MELPDLKDGTLAVAFANTLVHDGHGGAADLFADDDAARVWIAERALPTCGRGAIAELRTLRLAARALFASTVAPRPASRGDAGRASMPASQALRTLHQAADRLRVRDTYRLSGGHVTSHRDVHARRADLTPGILALAVLEFLASPASDELRACQAPRCVRYFVKHHGRQEWCKESCANRARVARHAERHRES